MKQSFKRFANLCVASSALMGATVMLSDNAHSASTTAVTNKEQLLAALATAKSGDTILLAQGVYSKVRLNNLKFTAPVTIASADAKRPAVFKDGVSIENSNYLTFKNIEFFHTGKTDGSGMWVYLTDHLTFDQVDVHGNIDDDYTNDTSGMTFSTAKNLVVKNSNLHHLFSGISVSYGDGVLLANNYIHNSSQDGIQVSSTSNITIDKNYIADQFSYGGAHKDGIQFFTQGTTRIPTNITITNNTFFRGKGQVVQGIFMGNEADNIYYTNVTIKGNAIIGGAWHGITLVSAKNATIQDNLVEAYKDMGSWIEAVDVRDSVVKDNKATSYVIRDNPGTTTSNNITIATGAIGDESVLRTWQSTHPDSAKPTTVWEAPAGSVPTPAPTPAPVPVKGTLAIQAYARIVPNAPVSMVVSVDGKAVGNAVVTADLRTGKLGTYTFNFSSPTKPKTVELTAVAQGLTNTSQPPLMVMKAAYSLDGKKATEIVQGQNKLAKQIGSLVAITPNGDVFYNTGSKVQIDVSAQ